MIKTDHGDRYLVPPAILHIPGEQTPRYVIKFDQDGVIRARTHGGWTLEEVDQYVSHLAGFVGEARRIFGRARLLIDRRETPLQPPAIDARFGRANAELYRDEDRLALVVESSLIKVQMRGHFSHPGSKAFLSCEAAETWLNAWNR
jgi:hypothetical protein